MQSPGTLRILSTHLVTFARLTRGRFLLLPPLMLVAGLFEGAGIMLFLPVFDQLAVAGGVAGTVPSATGSMLAALRLVTLPRLLAAIAVVLAMKFAVTLLQQVVIQRITRDLYRELSGRIMYGVARSEYQKYYLQTTTGTFTNVLTRELWTFLSAFSYACLLLVGVVYVAVYVAGALLIDPRMTGLAMACGVIVIIALRRWTGLAGVYSLQFTEANVRFQNHLIEFLQHFKYLKATARFPIIVERLRAMSERMTDLQYRMGVIGATVAGLPEIIAMLVLIVFLYVSVALIGNAFAATVVLAFLLYRTLMRVLSLQSSWQKFVGCSGALHAVEEVLAMIALHVEQRGDVRLTFVARGVAFEHVHFAYGDRGALTDITMRFPANRTIALVGPSGGGKSTIVDLLTGVLKPTSGRITVDDIDYGALDTETLRGVIGYVAQDIVMFNDTIAQNVAFWSPATSEEIQRRCAEASCDFVAQLPDQLATNVGERGSSLSVGQRQRIAIARELFRDPQLLIFDEATSALDSASEDVIRQHIERLSGTRTIVLIAHRLSTIRHADYLYVIDGGRVVEEGTFDALRGNPQSAFRTMCDFQRLEASAPR